MTTGRRCSILDSPGCDAFLRSNDQRVPMRLASAGELVTLLALRAQRLGSERAFTYLLDGDEREVSLSYEQLVRRAMAIASIVGRRLSAGERALLAYQPGLDFVEAFFGCLFAGVVAVPVSPPRARTPWEQLLRLSRDAGATTLLTTEAMAKSWAAAELPAALDVITTDGISDDAAADWRRPAIDGSSLAFIQYTSGSTSSPKGVAIHHEALLENAAMLGEAWEASTGREVNAPTHVSWLPPHHDMGLIGKIVVPIWAGSATVLLSPLHFIQRPARWLKAISRFRGAVSAAPNFAYAHCVARVSDAQLEALDLSSWTVAISGAERIDP